MYHIKFKAMKIKLFIPILLFLASCGELQKKEVFYAESLAREVEYVLENTFKQDIDFEMHNEIKTVTNSKHTISIVDSELEGNTVILYGLNSSDSVRVKRAVYEGVGRFIHNNAKLFSHYPTENESHLFAEAFRNSFELMPDAAFFNAKEDFDIRQTDVVADTVFRVSTQGIVVDRVYHQLRYIMETPVYYELDKLYNPKKKEND